MNVSTTLSRRHIALLAATALVAAGSAQAQTAAPVEAAAPAAQTTQAAPGTQRLTIRDVYDRVEAAGYRNQREIEFEHGHYDVKALNAEGARVKLKVNAQTGAVEQVRVKKPHDAD